MNCSKSSVAPSWHMSSEAVSTALGRLAKSFYGLGAPPRTPNDHRLVFQLDVDHPELVPM